MMMGSATSRAIGSSSEGESSPEMAPTGDAAAVAVAPNQGDSTNPADYRSGQLTAGEWSDLAHWDFWSRLMSNAGWDTMRTHWGIDPERRISALVVSGGRPVIDAPVRLLDAQHNVIWEARTSNSGRAELFAGIAGRAQGPYTIESQGRTVGVDMDQKGPGDDRTVRIDAGRSNQAVSDLDVMFVIDATGSMGDEMEYIKTELADVIGRAREGDARRLNIRLSCNFYRDEGDEYVVRSFPFTTSVDEAVEQIARQHADGGGDFEEAVEVALDDAITNHEWSSGATARLLFLVLDAPPHYSPDRIEKIQKLVADAARRGVRIIPVASSGVDKETEFLLRLLGITTGGTYLFLTDHSGIGDSHIQPTVGPYKVEYLNDLLVRLIGEYTEVHTAVAEGGGPSFK
jgi:hypothetical protein